MKIVFETGSYEKKTGIKNTVPEITLLSDDDLKRETHMSKILGHIVYRTSLEELISGTDILVTYIVCTTERPSVEQFLAMRKNYDRKVEENLKRHTDEARAHFLRYNILNPAWVNHESIYNEDINGEGYNPHPKYIRRG